MASTWDSILTAVSSLVDAATLTTVVKRKSAEMLAADTLPFWLVCAAGEEKPDEYAFTNLVHYKYPVAVLYVSAHNRVFTVDATLLTERHAIRNALDVRTLSGVAAVWDSEITTIPTTTYDTVPNTTFDVTGFIVTYDTYEVRGS